jgi:Arc/MetJ-type ribon-helix-helix transcriptional regulator
MIRTVISLDEDDKRWLDRRAAQEGVSMTELIRRAVRLLRGQTAEDYRSLEELLAATSGIWKQGDGLEYQNRLRDEW